MIERVSIRNFAIIEALEVELFPGLCVVTGETGAGKSVVIEALSLALGARADKSMVRTGTDRSVVTLVLEPEAVLTREVSAQGKSLCKVDGEIVTLATLAERSAGLVDVHGQYDHQSLLVPERHIGLLDAYGGERVAAARARVADAYEAYRAVKQRLDDVTRAAAASEREMDFLRFEVKEIAGARIAPGEDEELETRVRVMQSAEKIYEALARAEAALSGDGAGGEGEGGQGAIAVAGVAKDALAGLAGFGAEFEETAKAAADAYYLLEEIEPQIRAQRERTAFSQKELDDALARLDQLERLKKKYGGTLDAVLAHADAAQVRIDGVENADAKKAALAKELSAAEAVLKTESQTLSELRRAVSAKLEKAITEQLEELNFKNARFSATIETGENGYSENGMDRVEFLLSANKGQPLLPLAKVASGGELSRIMLAFKSVTGDFDGIETMIFDEIDSGISGVTASIVGEKLRRMAASHQVVCITHLPQIAACAAHHFVLEKTADGDGTRATMREVAGEERVREVARLLGGKSVTETTLASARELIEMAGTNV
ncbi:MAG: DNA repair protein RecN [Clostridiales Family XIII bacterium]|jgi:DNA repair protein RecN (Recombination protein N)|nr:DNA repair protein RecN [Clostridiales Family XIII bacterium]